MHLRQTLLNSGIIFMGLLSIFLLFGLKSSTHAETISSHAGAVRAILSWSESGFLSTNFRLQILRNGEKILDEKPIEDSQGIPERRNAPLEIVNLDSNAEPEVVANFFLVVLTAALLQKFIGITLNKINISLLNITGWMLDINWRI